MKSADRDAVKHALSMQEEKYRPPYGREVVMRPRRGVRVGSTNERQFLNDPTGARRFWLLEVTRAIDIPWVMAHRDQLWAQADALYARGDRWWFEKTEHAAEMAERHEAAYDADGIEVVLGERLTDETMSEWRQRGAVLLGEVAALLGIDLTRGRNLGNRLGDALRRHGFTRTQVRRAGKQVKGWKHRSWDIPPPVVDPAESGVPVRGLAMNEPSLPDADAPPDADLLADAFEALEAGRLPAEFAREELTHLLGGMPRVAAELRRRPAVRRMRELVSTGEYSGRSAAERVGAELCISPETIRKWTPPGGWREGSFSTHGPG